MDRRRMASLHARLSEPDDVKLSNLGSLKNELRMRALCHIVTVANYRQGFPAGVSAMTAPMHGILGYNAGRDRRRPRRPPSKIQPRKVQLRNPTGENNPMPSPEV
jgi:hypothetical protein